MLNLDKKEYKKYAEKRAKKSPVIKNCVRAFAVGGAICVLGQLLSDLFRIAGASEKNSGTLVSVSLIFLAAAMTCIGIFDNIAKFAGAGTLVPITGFSNAVVAPAIDTKSEGLVLGVGAKIFTIAGPVILYGSLFGVLYGVVYYLCTVW